MLHIVLVEPQIPQNTGNIGRMCAITGATLHLVHPLGFEMSDRYLKRSGMDYWQELTYIEHPNWDSFTHSPQRPERLWLFTTHATDHHWDAPFQASDGLVFGNETRGASEDVHKFCAQTRLKIPHFKDGLRSLNLASSAAVACYEALRQLHI